MAQQDGKLAFVHGARGIAALSVALFHCYDSTPVADRVAEEFPSTADGIVRLGFLGVDLFFVISGFVISLTLYQRLLKVSDWGRFFLRRQLRLDPPYWTAIAIAITSALVINHLRPGTNAPVPGVTDVLAHLFYLQGFLGIKQIVGIFWTLCFEIQFYLFFGACMLFLNRSALSGRAFGWVMLPLFILSIATFWDLVPEVPGLFVTRWFEFFAGVVVFLSWRREISGLQVAIYLTLLLAAAAFIPLPDDNLIARVTTVTVLLIALLFLLAVQGTGIKTWLGGPVLRYLGNISYSFYLTHALVGIRLLKIVVRDNDSIFHTWVLYAVGVLVSMAAADLLYRLVERPSMNLSHKLKWRSTT
jgi:peptidoglycan/LPS O-acetylase OafA/YrhL